MLSLKSFPHALLAPLCPAPGLPTLADKGRSQKGSTGPPLLPPWLCGHGAGTRGPMGPPGGGRPVPAVGLGQPGTAHPAAIPPHSAGTARGGGNLALEVSRNIYKKYKEMNL